MFRSTSRAVWLAVPLLAVLYFRGLDAIGLVGPDEPRYAAIGREMARSGDWVTPRLWGAPWFEKPALLYWMSGAGFKLGLGAELAPRLPVALCGAAFLIFFFWVVRREFGEPSARYATAILGTSAAWLSFSHVGVTDLPLTAAFAAAMLLSLRWLDGGDRRGLPAAAGLLGVAVLAKGLVPLVLAAPLLWMGRKRWLDWFRPPVAGLFCAVVLPWYVLCYLRNGWPFLQQLFWEQQVLRFHSEALAHPQPFWFYVPVLLGTVFPWTPALAALLRRSLYRDPRRRFLLMWIGWGLLFFSAATNKLPGYVLPLLPPLTVLGGVALASRPRADWILASTAALLILVPPAARILPAALAGGAGAASRPEFAWWWLAPLVAAALVWRLESAGRRTAALTATVLAGLASVVYLESTAFPAIDRLATARPLWRQIAPVRERVCVAELHRSLRYSLNYYSSAPLPDCAQEPREFQVRQQPGAEPRLTPASAALYPLTK